MKIILTVLFLLISIQRVISDEIKIKDGTKNGIYIMIPPTKIGEEVIRNAPGETVLLSNGKTVELIKISKFANSLEMAKNKEEYIVSVYLNRTEWKDFECVIIINGVLNVFKKSISISLPNTLVEFKLSGKVNDRLYESILDSLLYQK